MEEEKKVEQTTPSEAPAVAPATDSSAPVENSQESAPSATPEEPATKSKAKSSAKSQPEDTGKTMEDIAKEEELPSLQEIVQEQENEKLLPPIPPTFGKDFERKYFIDWENKVVFTLNKAYWFTKTFDKYSFKVIEIPELTEEAIKEEKKKNFLISDIYKNDESNSGMNLNELSDEISEIGEFDTIDKLKEQINKISSEIMVDKKMDYKIKEDFRRFDGFVLGKEIDDINKVEPTRELMMKLVEIEREKNLIDNSKRPSVSQLERQLNISEEELWYHQKDIVDISRGHDELKLQIQAVERKMWITKERNQLNILMQKRDALEKEVKEIKKLYEQAKWKEEEIISYISKLKKWTTGGKIHDKIYDRKMHESVLSTIIGLEPDEIKNTIVRTFGSLELVTAEYLEKFVDHDKKIVYTTMLTYPIFKNYVERGYLVVPLDK